MRRLLVGGLTALAVTGFVPGPGFAWQCPIQWRAAEQAIQKAESLNLTPDAKQLIEMAKRYVAESKKHHEAGDTKLEHAHSMWKAQAAKAMAEAAATISAP